MAMSIQTTSYITRESAIERIREMSDLIAAGNYIGIEETSFETEAILQDCIEGWTPFDPSNLECWTNSMLADCMDRPFFRHTLFENYLVVDELPWNSREIIE